MFAVSVPGLALMILVGLVAVGVIAWLLSPKDLTIDRRALAGDDDPGHHRR